MSPTLSTLRVLRPLSAALPLGALCAAAVLATPAARAAPQTNDARYATAKAGATVRNFADRQGLAVAELEEGTLVRVFGEPAGVGFVEVEVAAGFPIWVYGEYLQESGAPGVLRVSGSGVNMRPRPETSVANMPLGTKLTRGDRVEMIARLDSTKPMSEDWVRVWAPSRTRGWVLASETMLLDDQARGAARWNESQRKLPAAPANTASTASKTSPGAKPKEASAPSGTKPAQPKQDGARTAQKPKVSAEAAAALQRADALFTSVTANTEAARSEYEPVLAAYTEVIELAPAGSTTAEVARRRLEETRAHAGIAELRAEVVASERRMQDRLHTLSTEQQKTELARTPHWGRFHGRGRVESEVAGLERRYYLRWAGQRVCEVTCTAGRYDLSLFEGVEVGVMGHELRQALPPTIEQRAQMTLLDLYRVEVVSAARRPGR